MEYAVKLEAPQDLPSDPRHWCDAPWGSTLPAGRLTAIYFGSEFCEERIPAPDEGVVLCRLADREGLEAVLLTPLLRPRGLRRLSRLLKELTSQRWTPSVVFNDWGAERMLREQYAGVPRRGGKLLNRALRDPRVAPAAQPAGAMAGGNERGQRIRDLLRSTGAVAVEADADLEGGFLGRQGEGLQRVLHLPYVFVTSGRNCLLKAASGGPSFARGWEAGCAAPCGQGWLRETRSDTTLPLYRDGNTLLYEAPENVALSHVQDADRIVFHRRPAR